MFKTGLYLLFITFTQLIAVVASADYLFSYTSSSGILTDTPTIIKFIFLIEFVISIYLIKLGYEKEMKDYFNNNK
ncbi:MAG: hypothetical protein N2594_01705 [Clostridiales bacterium]|nr:hypothetical protein [Clostridiales bacterium]